MSDKSAIEWTDATWNPTTGCTKVSEGCRHCYIDRSPPFRIKGVKFLKDGEPSEEIGASTGVQLHPDRMWQPLKWKKPRRVFVNSLSDLFHPDVPDGFIAWVWYVMAQTPEHTYQILTKRPRRMKEFVERWNDQTGDADVSGSHGMPPMPRGPKAIRQAYTSGRALLFADMLEQWGEPPEGAAYPLYDWMEGPRFWGSAPLYNVWLGTSVEDQKAADLRIPLLLETPAAVRFLSCEPLLGPVDLLATPAGDTLDPCQECGDTGIGQDFDFEKSRCEMCMGLGRIHWVIAGGESGPKARPMHPDWARSLRDQCVDAGVPFFFKQWGEYQPADRALVLNDKRFVFMDCGATRRTADPQMWSFQRLGKKKAGRELDGRTWDQFPDSAGITEVPA